MFDDLEDALLVAGFCMLLNYGDKFFIRFEYPSVLVTPPPTYCCDKAEVGVFANIFPGLFPSLLPSLTPVLGEEDVSLFDTGLVVFLVLE